MTAVSDDATRDPGAVRSAPRSVPVLSPSAGPPGASQRRRMMDATAFIAAWVVAGYVLPIGSNGYLLLGIPLTAAFQTLVRRRPLRELYAADPVRPVITRGSLVMALALAVVPGWFAVRAAAGGHWTLLGWYLAAVAGAPCAAYALRAISVRRAVRSAVLPLAVGSGVFAVGLGLLHVISGRPLPVSAALVAVVRYSALYFPASFLLEEVTFRGAIDAHVHHEGDHRDIPSAVFVSTLWGLWHLPVSTGLPFPVQLAELVLVHIVLGVPLSLAWRRNRNLAAPALAHAVNDAVRNAFMLGL